MKIDYPREIALKVLYKINEENAYSNIALDEYLNINRKFLDNRDVNFISEIVYGVISRKLTLDYIVQKYSKIKINKISSWTINILREAAYQILFLDKVPKSAAVNEAVNLAKKYNFKSANFVNAILRRIEKSDYTELDNITNSIERLSLKYSMPEWIVKKIYKEYNEELVEKICKNSVERSNVTIRINLLKTNINEVKKQLNNLGIEFLDKVDTNFIYLKNIKNIAELDLFKNGFITVQDRGAGKIVEVLNPIKDTAILDACSAPGGKTTYLAEIMENSGKILACDIYEHRLKLVEENAKRLGINIIKTRVNDGLKYCEEYTGKFDKILLDVPCLGLGVLRRKPDIKWQRKEDDIKEISEIQINILKNCFKYLKDDGELVYSTCSILKEENEEIIELFTQIMKKKGVNIKKIYEEKIIPAELTDGFYICKIKKEL